MLTLQRLVSAIEHIKHARSEHDAIGAKVRAVGAMLRASYLAGADEAIETLRPRVAQHRAVGSPPSFVKVAGQSSLEKPLNRLLAWWCRDSEHGAGYAFLGRLVTHIHFATMASDLAAGDAPNVRAEEALDGDAGRQPDLVVTTRNAALLVENKLRAGESGDQYRPYLKVFQRDHAKVECQAWLSARSARECPPGWSGVLQHSELARIFEDMEHDTKLPFWSRVSAAVTAVAFEERQPVRELLAEAKTVLDAPRGSLSPGDVARARELARELAEVPLWATKQQQEEP